MRNPKLTTNPIKNDNISDPLMIPEATSSLASWLTYLTNQHNKIIDMEGIIIVDRDITFESNTPERYIRTKTGNPEKRERKTACGLVILPGIL